MTVACPVCGGTEHYTVFVQTPVGVQLPGDSDAARDHQSEHESNVCADCGVHFDPGIAAE